MINTPKKYRRIFTLLCMAMAIAPTDILIAAEVTHDRSAPACALTSVPAAKSYNLQQFKGKVVYVDFWASWCSSCIHSLPFMNHLHQDLKDKGLQILAINMDENPDDAQAFLTNHPADFMVLADSNQQCAKDFNVQAMPSSFLIDRNGIIRYEHIGFKASETEQVQTLIKQLLAESAIEP